MTTEPPSPPAWRRYRLIDDVDGSFPLGESVSGENVYIAVYARPVDNEKHSRDLQIGESSCCKYSLSGTTGIYRVLRLEDAQ